MTDTVVVTLACDGSVLIPCPTCSFCAQVKNEDIQETHFYCSSCEEPFESPFGRVAVRIAVKDDWDLLVDESWDVC